MRVLLAVITSLVFANCIIQAFAADLPPPKGIESLRANLPAPITQFIDLTGNAVTLDSFRGKTVILNVWATWCVPCIKEMPSLDRLSEKLDHHRAMVVIVSQDRGGVAIAKPFLDRLGVKNLSAYADPSGKLSRSLSIRGLPTTFIVTPSGLLVARSEGALEWDSEEVVNYIIQLNTTNE
jgi:thiol-disulfide isomerase/thioredoxin